MGRHSPYPNEHAFGDNPSSGASRRARPWCWFSDRRQDADGWSIHGGRRRVRLAPRSAEKPRHLGGRAMSDSEARNLVERLIAEARAGEAGALGALLEQYEPYLTLMARLQVGRRLQGKVDESDLVQETYLEAHRDFHRFRGQSEGEFLAWLRQILAHNLANAIRRYCGTQARDLHLERELHREFDESWKMLDAGLVAKQSSPSHQASRRERAVMLANALDRLPDDYREAIVLRHLEGLSFPQVAERMCRTEDSVKKLWARALGRLKRALESALEDSA